LVLEHSQRKHQFIIHVFAYRTSTFDVELISKV